ncbi:DEAD/DEAH box helicase family protein [Luteipulveratus halotolerans]|uniref:Restriction endonuclease subunit R n=1 Tax=Luteipulveratus halotolerans TaxID=1631356 RepID=A0A0L6CKG9_9MICO|nr:DEAD/DEAH box helicase family protein [Luteipulveratus halotolerans]KNX38272.1 restriction endonuclease subunit R [Luteipulveratus halotolerans]
MSNFAFVRSTLPELYDDCARAESYVTTDPVSACFWSRRAVEHLVKHLYDVLGLHAPYDDRIAARIDAAEFKRVTGNGINKKLNLIRRLGNSAVHDTKAIPLPVALSVLRELHHVMVWAAFNHSPAPQAVPTAEQFDPKRAAQSAPLSHAEVVALAQKMKAQDDAHAKALAEKDELAAEKDAEIARLQEQIKAGQAANVLPDEHDYTEAQTRDLWIDVLLREAGWPLTETRDREYPVTGMPIASGTTGSSATGKGFVDYVLWGADGLPLAVVEAKRTTKSAQIGQHQAKLYADRLEAEFGRRPVIFFTNGYEHWLWDDAAGYPPREVQGFYTRGELELMVQRRATRKALSTADANAEIAGRPYQLRAIKAVGDAFDRKQREALLVMATGTGKTRTVIALIDQMMKAGWVKRVLFLADRTALVRQATNAFKSTLPSTTAVNLVTERSGEGRVYTSTYPTMLNLINGLTADGDGVTTRKFGPGFFDLIVIDEAHRSVYQKYGAIFDWFDAMLVGLTATPKDEVDHNTYRLFHLEDGVPTDAYGLDEAVNDGWLVPARGVSVGTKFLRQGIRYDDLSEDEKDRWDALDWGEDGPPSEVGSEELNRFLFNEDTVDKAIATLMTEGHKVAGGDRLGKTIIFAKNQRHAEFIQRRFDAQFPELAGHFAQVITHSTSHADTLIDDFSTPDKAPHIAISVDMLDTGIDVPEVVNLVFFKMVRAKSKFWQMIGRGTRLCPDLFGPGKDKQDFLVFDFCGNLEFFSQDLPGSEGSIQKSLSQRLFEARVGLVTALDAAHTEPDLRTSTARTLHEFVTGMNLDNVIVRPHRRWVERYADWDAWATLTADDAHDVIQDLAGLPSTDRDPDEGAKRFDLLMLRRQLAQLDGDAGEAEKICRTVQAIAAALLDKTTIPSVAQQAELLGEMADDEWWQDVTLPMLEHARLKVRSLVQFIERTPQNSLYTDFADELIGEPTSVELPGITPGTDFERFRAKAAAFLRKQQTHVALQRLRRNKQLTTDDLSAMERMLIDNGIGDAEDVRQAASEAHGLGLFVRSLVGLDRDAVNDAFARYLRGSEFTLDQVRFVELIVDELTANGVMEPSRLFESPFTDRAPQGPDQVFPMTEVHSIVQTLNEVKEHAVPQDVA